MAALGRKHRNACVAPAPRGERDCAITFINHITFLLQFPGINVLTDPVYSERVSPVQWAGPRRVRAPGIAFDALPHIDIVLVSHNHYDHLDLDTLQRLQQAHEPVFLTGLGNGAFLQDHGLQRVHEFDWWQGLCASWPALHVHPRPALVGAWAAWPQSHAVGRFRAGERRTGMSSSPGTPVTGNTCGKSANAAGDPTLRCCRSVHTNRAGSCATST